MKLQSIFLLLLLLAVVAFAGCYTQLGYHASSNFEHGHHYRSVRNAESEHAAETEAEESEHGYNNTETESEEVERADKDTEEESEGYYGRRKRTSRTVYVYPDGYHTDSVPYVYAYPSFFYFPYYPFYGYRSYYGYRAPYYRYYSGYYPYRNVYRRYHSGSRYVPLSQRTYKKGDLRLNNRRSRSSRSVTSPRSRYEQPRQRLRNRNKK